VELLDTENASYTQESGDSIMWTSNLLLP